MLNLKFEQVRAFLHVARGDGNRRAANALHLTQPAITARLRNLEELLGTKLFERTESGRKLSEQGIVLFRYAEQLEHIVFQIERDVVGPLGINGIVRLGVAETIAQSWMPKVLRELQADYPNLQIEIQVDTSARLLNILNMREIDMAFANGIPANQRYKRFELPSIRLDWYTSASDPIDDNFAMSQLFGKPVITYPKDTLPYRNMRDSVWQRIGHDVPIIPSSSLSSTVRLVIEGVGVAAIPHFLAENPVREGLIRRFFPGWRPPPLDFAIHCLGDPLDPICERIVVSSLRIARHQQNMGMRGGQ
ncbi:LysR family transcriptional regulator [Pontivivens insulae]|uniref:HTH-type transcriptional regulator YofA n=1 Tax=Pontivivens insulae TaxID=1639689 RepID=A0A2R8AFX0_9RHOB|nr:LysR family transcriptional regulator [Pontivivens insulae]RED10694.1 DNA-binding transcriptional LysR family regulator [Pontivivens insulae]SPF31087.1 HTH-type transcriptional regulator YofA [Pontivivens insulae]